MRFIHTKRNRAIRSYYRRRWKISLGYY